MPGLQIRGGARRQRGYDALHDPRHFPQPVPSMAPRKFLVNQAVLASSAPSYRMRQPPGAVSDGHALHTDESRSLGAFGAAGNSMRGSEVFSHDRGKLLGSRVNDPGSQGAAGYPPRNAQRGAE